MVKKPMLIVILLSALLLLGGCWDQREINASAISVAFGVDLTEDRRIFVSALFAQPRPPEQSTEEGLDTVVVNASDHGVAMAARRLMLSMSQVPEWAHIQTIILGEKLVRNDLCLAIDFMTRNRNFRPDINLLVCANTSPDKVFLQINSLGNGGLKDLVNISENQLGLYTPLTIGEFTYRLMTPGIEPAVPIVILQADPAGKPIEKTMDMNNTPTNNKQEKIVLHEMAVFKGNKMVGTLNERQSRGYRWLNSNLKRGGIFIVNSPLQPDDYVALEIIRFSSKIRPQLSEGHVRMRIDIETNLAFYEVNGPGELLTKEMISQLEKAANSEISAQINDCISHSQQLNSDILGWGRKMQAYHPSEWEQLQSHWNEIFPYIEKDVHVKTHIKRSYLTRRIMEFK